MGFPKFIKWPSITNVSSKEKNSEIVKNINNWVVTEKLDGTNISVNVTRENVIIGRRKSLLKEGEHFYNVYKNANVIKPVIDAIKDELEKHAHIDQITIFGEYFGQNILNRIHYRKGYHFRFYSMCTVFKDQEDTVSWNDFYSFRSFMKAYGIENFMVPVLGTYNSFDKACNHPNNEVTKFSEEGYKDEMEGTVIFPLYHVPVSSDVLIFKSKNQKFCEKKCKSEKSTLEDSLHTSRLDMARQEFKNYCTESRMFSVISKEGKPESVNESGKYISSFIQDAKNDFLKDNPKYESLTEKETKYITNIGSLGFTIFKEVLAKIS